MEKETAIKILKALHDKSLFAERTALETIIPELKGSEDEKIRKTLIEFVKGYSAFINGQWRLGDFTTNELIAWLEKQESVGEIVERCKNSWYNEGKIDGMAEGLTEDEKYQQGLHDALEKQGDCSAKWEKNTPDNKPTLNHLVLMKTNQCIAEGEWNGKYWIPYRWLVYIKDSDVLAWMELSDLDEQGEQNPILGFKASNWYVSKVDGKIHDMTYNPADKVEPKFKIGDYIVSDYCMGRVVEITNYAYLLDTGQGIPFSCHSTRLWDISDAKDGDVLHSSEHKLLWIYKNKEEYHAAINLNYANFVSFGADIVIPSDVHPATKEQRDLLFQKMKEAGYTFDFDKKELKKIEDEIEIPFGAKDSELQEATYYIPDGFHAEIDDGKVVIKKGEKPTAWSEEDENYLQNAENAFEYQNSKNSSTILWLKSLKNRVQHQEWSEEDEVELDNAIYACLNFYGKDSDTADWLKSIKERIGG